MKLRNLITCALLCASTLFVTGCGDDEFDDFIGDDNGTGNGSTYRLTFQQINNANAILSDLFSSSNAGATLNWFGGSPENPTKVDGTLLNQTFNGVNGGLRTFHFAINDFGGITEDEEYDLQPDLGAQGAGAEYTEQGTSSPRWVSTSGRVRVTEIDDSGANFQFVDVRMNPGASNVGGNGTFRVDGVANLNYDN